MAEIKNLFVTKLYRAALEDARTLNADLLKSCRAIAADDEAGQAWSKGKGYKGYTSYASLDDLPKRDPSIGALKQVLDKHVAKFARELHLDLAGKKLKLDSIWINVLEPGGVHSGHIHPHSVVSGTYYVDTPAGASALKLEDPRHAMMMAAPPRLEDAPEEDRTFVYVTPKAGDVLMWESYLRHEVVANAARKSRVSISFNYSW
ncbi:TIGR02466 family protein [Vitreimonas flagellata]|uniref:TIGR02466 family protein n=1 Tax=Vitreimonas flagellata TaxID=2560861 RepID=UPI001075002C|nr:TIGR02466 family protein [Vitreimonas flagellata]